jgi:hypothetical protein
MDGTQSSKKGIGLSFCTNREKGRGIIPSFRRYEFTPTNLAQTHQALTRFLEFIRTKCPLLLENDPALEALEFLDEPANELTLERFNQIIPAMEKLVVKYINNVALLSNALRITPEELADIIHIFPNARLAESAVERRQTAGPLTRPLLLSVSVNNERRDIETGNTAASNTARSRSCAIL